MRLQIVETLLDQYLFGVGTFFVIWKPFMEYVKAKGLAKSGNLEGFKLTLDADFGDYYLLWVKQELLNFLTLTIYGRCFAKGSAEKWLDRRLAFRGTRVSSRCQVVQEL